MTSIQSESAALPSPEGHAEAVVQCRRCEQAGYLAVAHPIRPSIVEHPRILLVGQAPGAITDREGYHFAGPAGRVLETWFERAGFEIAYFRRHVYLSSLTRCFPGKASGGGDRRPSPAEIALCKPFLLSEIEILNPPLIVLVGKMAIDAFLPPRPLSVSVGESYQVDGRYLLPLPHASGVSRWLNSPTNRLLVEKALGELSRLRVSLALDGPLAPDSLGE